MVVCDLKTVKEHVKSLEDVLYYMVAAGYASIDGDIKYQVDGDTWHFNPSPTVVLARNEGNCGGTAGFVACLLEGDYDEVGMVGMSGAMRTGGHVANYIKDGNTYLAFDVSRFSRGYDRLLNLNKKADLNAAVLASFGADHGEKTYKTIYTYTGCYDGDAPVVLPAEIPVTYLIKGYVEEFNIVRETPAEGYVCEIIAVSQEMLDTMKMMRNRL